MMSLTEAGSRLSEIVDEVNETGSTVEISSLGRPIAVVMSFEVHESLIETLDILSDEATVTALAAAEQDVVVGDLVDHG